jgi:hypothetical protein
MPRAWPDAQSVWGLSYNDELRHHANAAGRELEGG